MNVSLITQIELENLRHLIGDEQLSSAKKSAYADAATHPELKQIFTKGAQESQSNIKKLKQFLQ